MKQISKIIQWLLALTLLSTSLWVFVKNQTLRKQINDLSHVQMRLSHLEKLLSDSRYIENFLGKLFPRVEVTDVVAGESRFTSFNDYILVLVFSASDCQPCLADALKMLNEHYIDVDGAIFQQLNITTGPLVFLVDSQNRITNAYYITPANLSQFGSFLKRFDRFLDSR